MAASAAAGRARAHARVPGNRIDNFIDSPFLSAAVSLKIGKARILNEIHSVYELHCSLQMQPAKHIGITYQKYNNIKSELQAYTKFYLIMIKTQ